NSSAGGTGGASTHTHPFSGTTGGPSSSSQAGWAADWPKANSVHTHTYSGTTGSGDNIPPYYELIIANPDSSQVTPSGLIGMIDTSSLPPFGWQTKSTIN